MGIVDLKFKNEIEAPVYPNVDPVNFVDVSFEIFDRRSRVSHATVIKAIVASIAVISTIVLLSTRPFPTGLVPTLSYFIDFCLAFILVNIVFDAVAIIAFQGISLWCMEGLHKEATLEVKRLQKERNAGRKAIKREYQTKVFEALKEHCATHNLSLTVLSPVGSTSPCFKYNYVDTDGVKHCHRVHL